MKNKIKSRHLIAHMKELMDGQDKFKKEIVEKNIINMPYYPQIQADEHYEKQL